MAEIRIYHALLCCAVLASVMLTSPIRAESFVPGRVSVRAQRAGTGSSMRQEIEYRDSEAVLRKNSAFLCGPRPWHLLGEMAASYTARRTGQHELAGLIAARFNKGPSAIQAKVAGEPADNHALRVWIGNAELTGSTSYEKSLLSLLEDTCEEADWVPVNGARIERAGNQVVITPYRDKKADPSHAHPASEFHCASRPQESRSRPYWECHIPPWGIVKLTETQAH